MSSVTICDVGPRDGLQNQPVTLAPAVRAELVDRLAAAGVPRIEAVSFVSPKAVPQMAGAEEVVAAIERREGVVYAGLALNEQGLRPAARDAGSTRSTSPSRRPRSSTAATRARPSTRALAAAERILERADRGRHPRDRHDRRRVRLPLRGRRRPGPRGRARRAVRRPARTRSCVADTIGVGVPRQVRDLVGRLAPLGVPVGIHLHNTRNTGFANAFAALEAGATVFDASVGGIGGCPFAPRATGNIATEDLVYLFHGEGVETGIDLGALIGVAQWLEAQLGRELEGQVYKAGTFAPVAG